MALDPPEPVVWVLNMMGLPWPGVNEDQLHDWARSVRQFSSDICDNSSQVNQSVRELADTSQSSVITSAADFWETHHQLLVDLREPLDIFAGALDIAADEVVAQKWVVIGAAGAMAAEFTATQIGAFFSFGADEAALPAEVAITREAVKEALEKLTTALIGAGLQYAMQEIVDHLNRTMGRILNTAFEVQAEAHSLKILYPTLRDTVQRIRSIINTIKEIASNAHSQNANRDLADSSGGGGWSQIIHAIEDGIKDFFKDFFKNLPSMIVQALESLVSGLLKLANRAKAADSSGAPDVSSGGSPTAPEVGSAPSTKTNPSPLFSREAPMTNAGILESGAGLPRTAATVEGVASRAGVDLSGTTVRIVDDPEYIRYLDYQDACACAPYEAPTEMHLGPASFADEETLAATLAHEQTHILQYAAGYEPGSGDLKAMEAQAYAAEQPALARLRGSARE